MVVVNRLVVILIIYGFRYFLRNIQHVLTYIDCTTYTIYILYVYMYIANIDLRGERAIGSNILPLIRVLYNYM